MNVTFLHPIIGQEAICPAGLGRVTAFKDDGDDAWIEIQPYVNNALTATPLKWPPNYVQLVDVGRVMSAHMEQL
jgi:hypothetical protein